MADRPRDGKPIGLIGLGLMGMNERANLVGATLEVESAPGQGTTVYLRSARARAREREDQP